MSKATIDLNEYGELCEFYYFLKTNLDDIKFANEYQEKRIKDKVKQFSEKYKY